jgi:hypothetical protein
MAALRIASALAGFALVSACAQAPIAPVVTIQHVTPVAPLPIVTSSGLVIGTVSYQYVELGAGEAPRWVVHVERVDDAQDYALPVEIDAASRRGVFTGALPAGVYAFREAQSAAGRYAPSAARTLFEVQAGEVRDAGHYALNPAARM